jgi:hypothetical protein
LVSITRSSPSRRSRSSTGPQKVPTPGPYSTNSRQRSQSTGASIRSIVAREEGMIEPTIRGCSRNPRKNTPAGPSASPTRCASLERRGSSAKSVPFIAESALPELLREGAGGGTRLSGRASTGKDDRTMQA